MSFPSTTPSATNPFFLSTSRCRLDSQRRSRTQLSPNTAGLARKKLRASIATTTVSNMYLQMYCVQHKSPAFPDVAAATDQQGNGPRSIINHPILRGPWPLARVRVGIWRNLNPAPSQASMDMARLLSSPLAGPRSMWTWSAAEAGGGQQKKWKKPETRG